MKHLFDLNDLIFINPLTLCFLFYENLNILLNTFNILYILVINLFLSCIYLLF